MGQGTSARLRCQQNIHSELKSNLRQCQLKKQSDSSRPGNQPCFREFTVLDAYESMVKFKSSDIGLGAANMYHADADDSFADHSLEDQIALRDASRAIRDMVSQYEQCQKLP